MRPAGLLFDTRVEAPGPAAQVESWLPSSRSNFAP